MERVLINQCIIQYRHSLFYMLHVFGDVITLQIIEDKTAYGTLKLNNADVKSKPVLIKKNYLIMMENSKSVADGIELRFFDGFTNTYKLRANTKRARF